MQQQTLPLFSNYLPLLESSERKERIEVVLILLIRRRGARNGMTWKRGGTSWPSNRRGVMVVVEHKNLQKILLHSKKLRCLHQPHKNFEQVKHKLQLANWPHFSLTSKTWRNQRRKAKTKATATDNCSKHQETDLPPLVWVRLEATLTPRHPIRQGRISYRVAMERRILLQTSSFKLHKLKIRWEMRAHRGEKR